MITTYTKVQNKIWFKQMANNAVFDLLCKSHMKHKNKNYEH